VLETAGKTIEEKTFQAKVLSHGIIKPETNTDSKKD
jgi:hypothetical protein